MVLRDSGCKVGQLGGWGSVCVKVAGTGKDWEEGGQQSGSGTNQSIHLVSSNPLI
jgi:hypothetical protein